MSGTYDKVKPRLDELGWETLELAQAALVECQAVRERLKVVLAEAREALRLYCCPQCAGDEPTPIRLSDGSAWICLQHQQAKRALASIASVLEKETDVSDFPLKHIPSFERGFADGREVGRAEERAAIVKWLRARFPNKTVNAGNLVLAIEQGDHLRDEVEEKLVDELATMMGSKGNATLMDLARAALAHLKAAGWGPK